MALNTDTIVAIATPTGQGGISIVRISGPEAIAIANKGFKGKADLTAVASHTAHFGSFADKAGRVLDDIVALLFRGPHSYTGEDVVEISCHGGMFVTRKILDACIEYGGRFAEPGEFTKRAFLNGRMDLAQAEAVADLIAARSESAHQATMFQLKGGLSERINALRDQLVSTIALLELELDFAEEGYEFADKRAVSVQLKQISDELDKLVSSFQVGRVYRDGVRVVLSGAPNVGKSSLLNALLEANRAIVTEIPGTTRDTIEESLTVDGLLFALTDTAGLRTTSDPVESEGVKRTEEQLAGSDLLVMMFDCTREMTGDEEAYARSLFAASADRDSAAVGVINKIDLRRPSGEYVRKIKDLVGERPTVCISAKTSEGLDELKSVLVNTALHGKRVSSEGSLLVTNARHYAALLKARESLGFATQSLDEKQSPEFVVVDLRSSLESLGLITGKTTTEDILNTIFSRFCIGK